MFYRILWAHVLYCNTLPHTPVKFRHLYFLLLWLAFYIKTSASNFTVFLEGGRDGVDLNGPQKLLYWRSGLQRIGLWEGFGRKWGHRETDLRWGRAWPSWCPHCSVLPCCEFIKHFACCLIFANERPLRAAGLSVSGSQVFIRGG